MGVEAHPGIGELGHVGAPDGDKAQGLEAANGGCVNARRWSLGENNRACPRHLARLVE
jgi:hypothetical protein